MESFLLLSALVVANVVGAAMALPQAVRLRRTRDASGVAPAWAVISAVANAWWILYGVGGGSLGVVPVAVFSTAVYVSLVAMLWRLHTDRRTHLRMVEAGVGLAAVPVAVLASGGWVAVGVMLGALYGVQLTPAVVTAYRSDELDGVSPSTWLLALLEALLFGIYGFAVADLGILVLAAFGTAGSVALLARLWRRGNLIAPARPVQTAEAALHPQPATAGV